MSCKLFVRSGHVLQPQPSQLRSRARPVAPTDPGGAGGISTPDDTVIRNVGDRHRLPVPWHFPDLRSGVLHRPAIQGGVSTYSTRAASTPATLELRTSAATSTSGTGSSIEDGLLRRVEALLGRFRPRCRTICYLYPGGTKLISASITPATATTTFEQLGGIRRRQLEVVLARGTTIRSPTTSAVRDAWWRRWTEFAAT